MPKGQHEQTRNIAYLMLRRRITFWDAACEYLAALEKGSRQVASDAELDLAAADLLRTINDHLNWARLGLVGGVPLVRANEASATAATT